MAYRVILIHDFLKNYKDMEILEDNLIDIGYKVESLNFPLTFPELKISIELLKEYLLKLKNEGYVKREEIILIGHGFGGNLIKETLKDPILKNIVDKILFISSPLKDSTLHRRMKRIFPFIDFIFKPLKYFSVERGAKNKKNDLLLDKNIEVGLIIGTEEVGFFSKFLSGINDGYVTIKDADISPVKDKILIPIPHREIHKNIGTAKYIHNFISKGNFKIY